MAESAGIGGPVTWLRHAVFRSGVAALRRGPLHGGAGAGDGEVVPGVLVVGKDAGPDRVTLWVGAFLRNQRSDAAAAVVTVSGPGVPPRRIEVELLRYRMDDERSYTGYNDAHSFYHRHVDVDGLPRGVDLDARVEVPGTGHTARAVVATLPAAPAVGGELDVFTASCYDVGTDPGGAHLDALYRRIWGERRPDLTLLTGDQAYLDAPWWFFALLARGAPRTYYLMKYWTTWGGDPAVPGLRTLLGRGPNWFLPDDHEFWNNWPHRSVTAFHSFTNIGRALRGGLARQIPSRWLSWGTNPDAPADASVAPTDAVAQNYLPVHPDEWGAWSRGAFDLIGSFQTRSPADRADSTRIPRGEDPWPIPAQLDGTPAPLNDLCQRIDLGPVQAVLLDTRTRRTRAHQHPIAQFTDPDALAAMLTAAAEADVFVLAIPQPILRAALYPKQSARTWLDHSVDRGMEDYWHQYERFWRGLVDARRGRPTVVLAGDIHQCMVSHVPELALVEVVASPMSLVSSPALLDAATPLVKRVVSAVRGPKADPTVAEFFAGPTKAPAPVGGTIVRDGSFAEGEPGVARVHLTREGERDYRLDVTVYRREPDSGPDLACSFTLTVPARTDNGTAPSPAALTLVPVPVAL